MHPVRVSCLLVTACAALELGQAATAGFLLLRYARLVDALGPWTRLEALVIENVYVHLVGAAILAAGVGTLLTGAALAVPRRNPYTRTVVGWTLLLVTVTLLLGVVYSPDAVLLPDNQRQLDHLQPLLPLWYSAQQGLTVTAVIACAVTTLVKLGGAAAGEYYQRHDPNATWHGFTSWLDVRFRD